MKIFRLLYLLLFALSISAVAEELKFKTPSREISVESWRAAELAENAESDHYYLCLSAQINVGLKGLKDLGVRFIGAPDYGTNDLWVYHVEIYEKYTQVVELLKTEPTFLTLISRIDRDKLSYAIANDEGSPVGAIMAKVDFDGPITIGEATELLDKYVDSTIDVQNSGGSVTAIVMASTSALRTLASREEIGEIREFSPLKPTMDNSRVIMKVDSLQFAGGFDTTRAHFPPSATWNANVDYTGAGVWAGIYDTGMDPLDSNFREDDDGLPGGTTTLREAIPFSTWHLPSGQGALHGGHVGNITGGNGWRSHLDSSFGATFQWRGVAPKVRFISGNGTGGFTGMDGDVNNHSTTLDTRGWRTICWYSASSVTIDRLTWGHDTANVNPDNNNTLVWAVGNAGLPRGALNDSSGCGLYSMNCNAKNPIKVGGACKYTGGQAPFSSMGPTRDGRIGPDVIAPGGGSVYVERYRVDIDSICWKSNTGAVKRGWNFTAKKNNNLEDSLWWGRAAGLDSMWIENGALSIIGPSLNTNALFVYSDTIPSIYTDPTGAPHTDPFDSLIITYRVTDSLSRPGFPIGQKRLITMGLGCSMTGDPNFDCEILLEANTGWHTLRARWRNTLHGTFIWNEHPGWPGNGSIERFHMLITTLPIMSANLTREGLYDYTPEQGTSMACPQVTGVVALMLQKYGETMLSNINRIHTHPFWNSTAKAILAHTATDVVDTSMMLVNGGQKPEYWALWRNVAHVNGVGPDWGTGYGLVNAAKAVEYVSPNHFREDTVSERLMKYYDMVVPPGTPRMKVTMAWDDLEAAGVQNDSTAFESKLVNDVNLYLLPPTRNGVSRPWCLSDAYMRKPNMELPPDGVDSSWINGVWTRGVSPDTIKAHPAYPGNDSLNNVEMVDVNNPISGTWTVVVEGRRIRGNQSVSGTLFEPKQDFSLVYDFDLTPNTTISNAGKDLPGMQFREGNQLCARMTVVGNLQVLGSEEVPVTTPTGLRFRKPDGVPTPATGFMPTTGNLMRNSMVPYSAAWLANPANLQGGLVFRNQGNQVMAHISMTGAVHLRSADFHSVKDM
jgi:subtilisin family serine protease